MVLPPHACIHCIKHCKDGVAPSPSHCMGYAAASTSEVLHGAPASAPHCNDGAAASARFCRDGAVTSQRGSARSARRLSTALPPSRRAHAAARGSVAMETAARGHGTHRSDLEWFRRPNGSDLKPDTNTSTSSPADPGTPPLPKNLSGGPDPRTQNSPSGPGGGALDTQSRNFFL